MSRLRFFKEYIVEGCETPVLQTTEAECEERCRAKRACIPGKVSCKINVHDVQQVVAGRAHGSGWYIVTDTNIGVSYAKQTAIVVSVTQW